MQSEPNTSIINYMGIEISSAHTINYRGGYSSLAFSASKETKTTNNNTYNNYDHMALNTCGLFYVKNSTLNRGEGDKNKI